MTTLDPIPITQTYVSTLCLLAACALTLHLIGLTLYNLTLHPLAAYPGPLHHRASPIPFLLHEWRGTTMHKWAALHARYGSVVRIAPDQLSYTTPAAWRDIYGVRGTSNKDAAAPSQMDKEELTFPGSSFEFFAPAKPMISLFPPGAINMPRTVPGEGAVIDGAYVPGGMTVGVAPYAAYRAERYWVDAGEFRPERWLEGGDGKGRYAGDMREVFKPFGYGPRNCVGQALAMVECRVVIARLFWRFEVEVLGGQDAWMGQKTFLSWEKPRLMVKVRSREARA